MHGNRIANFCSAVVLLMVVGAMGGNGATAQPTSSLADTELKVWSFDLWCLEMELYPRERCDRRQAADLEEYAEYRTMIERLQQERTTQQTREQATRDRLNRDPTDINRPTR